VNICRPASDESYTDSLAREYGLTAEHYRRRTSAANRSARSLKAWL